MGVAGQKPRTLIQITHPGTHKAKTQCLALSTAQTQFLRLF